MIKMSQSACKKLDSYCKNVFVVCHWWEINMYVFFSSKINFSELWSRCSCILVKSTFNREINISELSHWREMIDKCISQNKGKWASLSGHTFSWNQHFSVFEVKSTSLSSSILMKSTFRSVWSEINIFWLTRSREINILLCLKWNRHLCSHKLTWNRHFNVIEVGKNYFVVGRWLFNMWKPEDTTWENQVF